MRKKTRTVGGDPAFAYQLNICITLRDFAIALCERAYNDRGLDFESLTKTKAKEILHERIQFHGRHGEYDDPDGVGETQDEYNEYFIKARGWVAKNYPWLLK